MKLLNEPFVSVVLCFYNEEQFLAESVESVLAQSYAEWELILVDDGTEDGSTAIARRYANCYPGKIRYLDHKGHRNEGLSASRNLGISKSVGDLIAFIDADDVWLPEKLVHQVRIFEEHPDVMVALQASLYWNSWKKTERPDVVIPVGVPEGAYDPPQLMMQLYPLGKGAAPCPSGLMVRRSVFSRHRFEESFSGIYQMYEDQAFLSKVYLKERVFVSACCHNKYRQRLTSIVATVQEKGKYHTVRCHYLLWFSRYLKTQGIPFRKLKVMVLRARMQYTDPVIYKILFDTTAFTKALAAKALVRMGLLTYHRT